ncbi:hypothetical protein PHISCL_06054 [Aspergillus sclerotialis]|uniref:Uncharacterized protein n=1 Tax=Aspergillus sclerotialis TaxID=2070753 RepID=A0A3A2ZEP3_9EURO|nr:hypothetical protein PHISCL_06054 [Aspergillus sclerotialis]
MIRFPPTSISLSEDEVEYHLHRIVYHYSLEAEFRRLHQGHDHSDNDDDSEHLDSFYTSPHFGSSPGISDSDSRPGFDPGLTGKGPKTGFSKDSDGRSSGSWNVRCPRHARNVDLGRVNNTCSFNKGAAIDTSIVPTPSTTSQTLDSLSIDSGLEQHKQSQSVISVIPDSSPTSISYETCVNTTTQQTPQSTIHCPDLHSLSTALRKISLRAPVDSSPSFSETPLTATPHAGKGSENQRTRDSGATASGRRFSREWEIKEMAANEGDNIPPGRDDGILHPQRTHTPTTRPSSQVAPMEGSASNFQAYRYSFPKKDNTTDTGQTTQHPHSESRVPQTTALKDQATPMSTASFWTPGSPSVREAQSTRSRPRRHSKGYRLSPSDPGDQAENHSPSLADVLVEAKKLQGYFAAMVADLGVEDDPDDFGLKELRRQPLGGKDTEEDIGENIE